MRLGIIGAGEFGAQHASAVAALDGIELVAASRTNASAVAEFARRFGCAGHTNYQNLLGDASIDAVLVATPHTQHTEITVAALDAGKHVLLEKPMATALDDCDAMLDAAARAGRQLMVGHINHFVPAYVAAKEIIAAGEIGEVVHAHSTMTRPWMTDNRRSWHLDPNQGGGMWLTIGVHVVDQLGWLIDSPARSVTADLSCRFHDQRVDDLAVAFIRYGNRATATASAIGYRTGVFEFRTEVVGTRGLLRIDHAGGVRIGSEEVWSSAPGSACADWMATALRAQWQAFANAVENGLEVPVSGAYARHIMAVVLAALDSSRRRCEVDIGPPAPGQRGA